MKPFTNSITYKNIKHECVQFVTTDAFEAYYYALHVLKQRWADIGKPEAEDLIGTDAEWAYWYALNVLTKRWADVGKPEVEDVIGTDAKRAYWYAHDVLKKRWADIGKPEVEDLFRKNSVYCRAYEDHFNENIYQLNYIQEC